MWRKRGLKRRRLKDNKKGMQTCRRNSMNKKNKKRNTMINRSQSKNNVFKLMR